MNPIECALLLSNLSRTREWLLPGNRMPFHEYWQHCFGPFAEEIGGALRAGQFILWVDGCPVVDPKSQMPITVQSQFALSLGRRGVTALIPHGFWWN
jgi:hypothetical protein